MTENQKILQMLSSDDQEINTLGITIGFSQVKTREEYQEWLTLLVKGIIQSRKYIEGKIYWSDSLTEVWKRLTSEKLVLLKMTIGDQSLMIQEANQINRTI